MTADGIVRMAWPDGGPVIDQPALTVEMFDVLSDLAAKELQWQLNK